MKTKFIKVSVEERLPQETGTYYTQYGYRDFNEETGLFYDRVDGFISKPDFYFEETPDREEEMREMLHECLKSFNWISGNCTLPTINNEDDAEDSIHYLGYRKQELEKLLNK